VPETTESTVVSTEDQVAVFDYLADFSNLAEWDPTFVSSEKLDTGSVGEGTRFRAVMKLAGSEHEITWTVTEHDAPRRVVLDGVAETFTTQEDIRVEPDDDGTKVTYTGRFETDTPDAFDAMSKPGFWVLGKVVIRQLRDTVEEQTRIRYREGESSAPRKGNP
jgi:hypothetical protein